jgi:hypothetical protein
MSVCSQCGGVADFAVHTLISTKRKRPRAQKCSPSVHFCDACLQSLCDASVPLRLVWLTESLTLAYTAIAGPRCGF